MSLAAPHSPTQQASDQSSKQTGEYGGLGTGSIYVSEIDLPVHLPVSMPIPSCREARFLIRVRRRPIGWISFSVGDEPAIDRAAFQTSLRRQLGHALLRAYARMHVFPSLPEAPPLAPITVVVCTRDRPANLAACLKSLLNLDYPEYEVVVVDNAPASDETRRVSDQFPVRYVREDAPGLDRARNRGIMEASHDLVAFADDDVVVDAHWLRAFNDAFRSPEVSFVTGLVVPLELRSAAQIYFEDVYGGMQKGMRPRLFKREGLTVSQLLWASGYGVGANMAFRRDVLEKHGSFDAALDAGTPSLGGGDLEMFHRLLAAGCTLKYEPGAIVWHRHRATEEALKRQLYANGRSFGVYLLTCMRRRSAPRRQIAWFALRHWIAGWMIRRLLFPGRHRRSLVWTEFKGMLSCVFARRESLRFVSRTES